MSCSFSSRPDFINAHKQKRTGFSPIRFITSFSNYHIRRLATNISCGEATFHTAQPYFTRRSRISHEPEGNAFRLIFHLTLNVPDQAFDLIKLISPPARIIPFWRSVSGIFTA